MKHYIIYFHDVSAETRRWLGNSKKFNVRAHNVVHAIKRFYKQPGNELPIYDIAIAGENRNLGYDATQALLRLEGYLPTKA